MLCALLPAYAYSLCFASIMLYRGCHTGGCYPYIMQHCIDVKVILSSAFPHVKHRFATYHGVTFCTQGPRGSQMVSRGKLSHLECGVLTCRECATLLGVLACPKLWPSCVCEHG